MRKLNEENERTKRLYLAFLKHAKGQDEASIIKVASTMLDFEEALGFVSFRKFHRDWAARYKKHLDKRRNKQTGKPLGLTTKDASLRQVKAFFHWLAGQPGFKSRVTYPDVEYFNNTCKDARAAHAQRPEHYPSLEQCAHAFRQMPEETLVDRRDKAIFACLMLTCGRDDALASLRLKHVDIFDGSIFFDGREVRTKNRKVFTTWFFPVDVMYRQMFEAWVKKLRGEMLFGPGDALFPKKVVGKLDGKFAALGLAREPYSNADVIRKVVKASFRNAGLPEYTPHLFRKTLGLLANEKCENMEQIKSWSQNMGHDHLATTVTAYMPVSPQRQKKLLQDLQD